MNKDTIKNLVKAGGCSKSASFTDAGTAKALELMGENDKIQLFEDKRICTTWDEHQFFQK